VARMKTLPTVLRTKQHLAQRITALRIELFGPRGGPELARRLGIPTRTWYNYEGGITVPGEILLKIVEVTSVEPMWLLHGRGPKFSNLRHDSTETSSSDGMTTTTTAVAHGNGEVWASPRIAVCALLKAALRLLETELPESSNHDGTLTRPASLDSLTAAFDPESPLHGWNAPRAHQSRGNGTDQ
jgi:hypothetical protein